MNHGTHVYVTRIETQTYDFTVQRWHRFCALRADGTYVRSLMREGNATTKDALEWWRRRALYAPRRECAA